MTIRSAALVISPSRAEAIAAAKELAPLLYSAGFSLYTISEVSIEGIKKVAPADLPDIEIAVVLGGDGTILWASKQFSGQYVPPMITFDQGSLGFLCNFVFEDHEEVMKHVFESIFSKKESEFLGLDSRMRLRVNMGVGNET